MILAKKSKIKPNRRTRETIVEICWYSKMGL